MYIRKVSYIGFELIWLTYGLDTIGFAISLTDKDFYSSLIETDENGHDLNTGELVYLQVNDKDFTIIDLYNYISENNDKMCNICSYVTNSVNYLDVIINMFICLVPRELDLKFRDILCFKVMKTENISLVHIMDICDTFIVTHFGECISLIDYIGNDTDILLYKEAVDTNKNVLITITDLKKYAKLNLQRQKWEAKQRFIGSQLTYSKLVEII